jgi:hypothetical protein
MKFLDIYRIKNIIQKNDLQKAQELILEGVSTIEFFNMVLLEGSLMLVNYLLQYVSSNQIETYGLITSRKIVQIMQNHNVAIHQIDNNGYTLLYKICKEVYTDDLCHINVDLRLLNIKWLLDNRVDPNSISLLGDDVLDVLDDIVFKKYYNRIIVMLLDYGYDPFNADEKVKAFTKLKTISKKVKDTILYYKTKKYKLQIAILFQEYYNLFRERHIEPRLIPIISSYLF